MSYAIPDDDAEAISRALALVRTLVWGGRDATPDEQVELRAALRLIYRHHTAIETAELAALAWQAHGEAWIGPARLPATPIPAGATPAQRVVIYEQRRDAGEQLHHPDDAPRPWDEADWHPVRDEQGILRERDYCDVE